MTILSKMAEYVQPNENQPEPGSTKSPLELLATACSKLETNMMSGNNNNTTTTSVNTRHDSGKPVTLPGGQPRSSNSPSSGQNGNYNRNCHSTGSSRSSRSPLSTGEPSLPPTSSTAASGIIKVKSSDVLSPAVNERVGGEVKTTPAVVGSPSKMISVSPYPPYRAPGPVLPSPPQLPASVNPYAGLSPAYIAYLNSLMAAGSVGGCVDPMNCQDPSCPGGLMMRHMVAVQQQQAAAAQYAAAATSYAAAGNMPPGLGGYPYPTMPPVSVAAAGFPPGFPSHMAGILPPPPPPPSAAHLYSSIYGGAMPPHLPPAPPGGASAFMPPYASSMLSSAAYSDAAARAAAASLSAVKSTASISSPMATTTVVSAPTIDTSTPKPIIAPLATSSPKQASAAQLSSASPSAGVGGASPYLCSWSDREFCGRRFNSSDELMAHLRSHTANLEAPPADDKTPPPSTPDSLTTSTATSTPALAMLQAQADRLKAASALSNEAAKSSGYAPRGIEAAKEAHAHHRLSPQTTVGGGPHQRFHPYDRPSGPPLPLPLASRGPSPPTSSSISSTLPYGGLFPPPPGLSQAALANLSAGAAHHLSALGAAREASTAAPMPPTLAAHSAFLSSLYAGGAAPTSSIPPRPILPVIP